MEERLLAFRFVEGTLAFVLIALNFVVILKRIALKTGAASLSPALACRCFFVSFFFSSNQMLAIYIIVPHCLPVKGALRLCLSPLPAAYYASEEKSVPRVLSGPCPWSESSAEIVVSL